MSIENIFKEEVDSVALKKQLAGQTDQIDVSFT